MYTKPKGTNDILPNEIYKWHILEKLLKNICRLYNFKEIRTPIFEMSDTIHRNNVDSSDMVSKETYDFLDRSGRKLTLRPEGTCSVCRSYVENKMYVSGIQKLYYIGPMFRYERPQKGRFRQFHQFGLEILGSGSYICDFEVILMCITIFKKIGLNGLRVRINNLGDINSREKYKKDLLNYLEDKIDCLCSDCKERINKNPLRILDCKIDSKNDILTNCPQITNYLSEKDLLDYSNLKDLLNKFNICFIEDPYLVRGLDYYNNTVFEIEYTDSSFGSQNVLCAGGRYNNLISELNGPKTECFGCAFGIERIIDAIELEDPCFFKTDRLDCFIATLSDKAFSYSLNLVNILREKNITCEFNYEVLSLKNVFSKTDKLMPRYIIFIGEDEINSNTISIKDLDLKKTINLTYDLGVKYILGGLHENIN